MDVHENIIRSRLIQLLGEPVEGELTALDIFWGVIAGLGSTRIEPIPGNERDRLVTFYTSD